MKPIEEDRRAVLPEVIIQLRVPTDPEAICPFCKDRLARPAVLEAFYKGIRVSCCSEKECQEKAKGQVLEAWLKARRENLEAEFDLASRQRETQ